MSQRKKKMVTGVFRDRYDAERAFDYMHSKGYLDSEIDVLMSDKTRSAFYPTAEKEDRHPAGTKATEGMAVGGALGTAVGATLAAVVVAGTSVVLPGLGIVIFGPLSTALAGLAGAGAGAITGGIVGALVGAGITEQNAQAYEDALRNGGVVIGVTPRNTDDAEDIERVFKDYNGENVCYC
jgi:hypothetical protein